MSAMSLTSSLTDAPRTINRALSPHKERVLRLAAKTLPGIEAQLRTPGPISGIARELRRLAPYYVHLEDTHQAIQSWLEVYGAEQ